MQGRVRILEVHCKGKARVARCSPLDFFFCLHSRTNRTMAAAADKSTPVPHPPPLVSAQKLAADVDLEKVARMTSGFTGADLQNLMNEAAILTARRGCARCGRVLQASQLVLRCAADRRSALSLHTLRLSETTPAEISDALERIALGVERKGALQSPEKRRVVATHEAGHAVVGALLPEYDRVSKISIVPRGWAGGVTIFTPDEAQIESGLYSRQHLRNRLAVALGGRVAEEIAAGGREEEVTTGAANDLEQVTRVARMMVSQFGFSEKLGQLSLGGGGNNTFLGQARVHPWCSARQHAPRLCA